MAESFTYDCTCPPQGRGTVPPSLLPYVYSVNDLQGQITLAGTGAVDISSLGNTITIDVSAEAGLGSVTSVALASSSSNLTIVSGSPITTNGTITLNLAGNIGSIAGLTMAADQMLYSTAADTFAATSLTAFARTLLDDAAAVNARSTLGLVIGTNVQAWSADLDSFVTQATWAGPDLSLAGALTIAGHLDATTADFSDPVTMGDSLSVTLDVTVTGDVTAAGFTGSGLNLTALNASQLTTGTVAVARGGTNIASYAIGDLLYAGAATTLSKLASVAAGSYLRSGGVTTAPVWSTLVLPNAATVGDIFSSSTTNTMSRITAVATGNALISGGVATLPSWGKITTSHTTGIAASGSNSDITSMSAIISITSTEFSFTGNVFFAGDILDASFASGGTGYIFTSTGSGATSWSNQIAVDTIAIETNISLSGTITAGGVTGAQTINKPSGTVNFAAAASSLVVTNSLATTSHRVQCTVCTNDTTAKSAAAVVTNGAFTIFLNAAATAETAVYWTLIEIT